MNLFNETARKLLVTFEKVCDQVCSMPNCEDDVTVTSLYAQNPFARGLSFRVYLPRSANVRVIFKPRLILLDYVTLVLSCFGTWLGLSVLQLDPVVVWRQLSPYFARNGQSIARAEVPKKRQVWRSNSGTHIYRVATLLQK